MRPTALNPLFASVTALKGVGPRLGKLFEKLGAPLAVDLLWHLPTGLIDRRFAPKVADAPEGAIATLTVEVDRHMAPHNPREIARWRRESFTGAACTRFCVNTAAAFAGMPLTISARSGFSAARIPA